LKQNSNHLISHRIVEEHPHSIIGLEDLAHIRERTNRKRSKKASKKQRKSEQARLLLAFAELHCSIAYKALLAGKHGDQGGCLLHEPGMPQVWVCQPSE